MTKNEFINLVASEFLASHSAWRKIYENRREYSIALGRDVGQKCLVFVDLACRPDRYWFGHGVGWCESQAYYLEWQARRVNPPIYKRSGRLRHLESMETPLDIENAEMRICTFSLHKPYANYDLEKVPADDLKAEILTEMDQFALPYLRLFLRKKHGVELSQDQISNETGVVA